jgi:lipopolysaccharide exporter
MSATTTHDDSTTRGEIATGVAWMLAFKLTERSLGLVSTIFLVRLLAPADFGVMAMAMSLIAILELLKSFSFDVALIQRQDVRREHLDTAWSFNLIFGVLVSLLMVALAKSAAAYYAEPHLEAVTYALAVGWFIQSFENIGPIAFRRDLKFRSEYRFLVAKKVATVMVTLPLAYWLQSYWALVVGVVAGKGLSVLISYVMHPHRPRLSVAAAADLLGISGWLLINNILYFLNERLTDFAVGRIAGARALGLYNISFEIANMPTSEIVAPINRAMLPGYSKIARERGDLGRTYLDTVGLTALFSMPAGLGVAALAAPLVTILLGAQWLPAIPLIAVLGVYGAIVSVGTNISSALLALGRQRALTSLAALRLALLAPAITWATGAFGVLGTAWAVLVVTAAVMPINFVILLPVLGIRGGQFIGAVWRPVVASAAMYVAVRGVLQGLSTAGLSSPLLQLTVGAVTACLALVATLGLLWLASGRPEGAETVVARRLAARWPRRGKRVPA